MNSRFRIAKDKFGKQGLIKLFDTKTNDFFSILPETGAMLLEGEFYFNGKAVSILDTYKTENELIDTLGNSFKGSNLFPFPNRIDGGKYSFAGQNFELPVNFENENNAIHGLVYDKKFEVTEEFADDNMASVTLQYLASGDLPGYPFKFALSIKYKLDTLYGISIRTTVTNEDKQAIPVGFGFHPYFKLDKKVNELNFEFPSTDSFKVNNRMLPTTERETYNAFNQLKQIESGEFDTCFSINTTNPMAVTKIHSNDLQGGIEIWQETGTEKLNFLQVYTPPHRDSIAIEPMTCIANAYNNKVGLIELQPTKSTTVNWGIRKIG